nr:MAG TPA: Nuclease [Caudoviricetes sp.]
MNKDSYNKRLLEAIKHGQGTNNVAAYVRRTQTMTESEIQQACFKWFRMQYPRMAVDGIMYHIANEGVRVGRQGYRVKREGLVKGVADICLAVPRHGYGALYIEMKRPKTFDHKATYQSPEQKTWQASCEKYGNKYVVCRSVEEFKKVVDEYLNDGTEK